MDLRVRKLPVDQGGFQNGPLPHHLVSEPSSGNLNSVFLSPWYTSTLTPVDGAVVVGLAGTTWRTGVCTAAGTGNPRYSPLAFEAGTSSCLVSSGLRNAN